MIIFVGTPQTKAGCSLISIDDIGKFASRTCVVLCPKLALHCHARVCWDKYISWTILMQFWSKHTSGDPQGTSAICLLYPRKEYIRGQISCWLRAYKIILWSNIMGKGRSRHPNINFLVEKQFCSICCSKSEAQNALIWDCCIVLKYVHTCPLNYISCLSNFDPQHK